MSEHNSGVAGGPDNDPRINVDPSGYIIIDPTIGSRSDSGGGSNDSDGGTRRRGGRRGPAAASASATSQDKATLNGLDIKDVLISIHMMAASFFHVPELELDETEAKRLDAAIKRVSRHYPMNVSQKHLDTAYLATVIAKIYGTRAIAIYAARKSGGTSQAPANAATSGDPNNIIDFNLGATGD